MVGFPKLFEPATIGALEVRNRLIMAPMDKNYASATGAMTQRYVDYLAERARGGVGLILTEATYVDPRGRNRVAQLGLHDDGVVPSSRAAVAAVHAQGARLGAQLHFAGRQASSWATGGQPVAPSPVPCPAVPSGDVPRELTLPEIGEMVASFAVGGCRLVLGRTDLPFGKLFRKGLRELGWVDGQNVVIEERDGGETRTAAESRR